MRKIRQKRKNKKLKFVFTIILLFLILHIFSNQINEINKSISNIFFKSKYQIIKQDSNENYLGIGQEKVKNKDGYFTTFTTIDYNKKTYIEYKQNGNSSWKGNEYWGGTMEENRMWNNRTFNNFKWI